MERQRELTQLLREACKAYYKDAREIMSNYEYDRLYDELKEMESATGIVYAGSPTQMVGYDVLTELPKETHATPMLSLDKTKDRDELANWLGNHEGIISWKMDGLTVVLTYENGMLVKAVTRGNGEIGELITSNARVFENVPLTVPFIGNFTVRGEAVISYEDFATINESLSDDKKYKNPRNLASGSVRQLDSSKAAQRHIHFIAFELVHTTDDGLPKISDRFRWLESQGFTVVERFVVYKETVKDVIDIFQKAIEAYPFPSDGLVLMYNDVAYGESLGRTAKFPRNGMAFKWTDETARTTLRDVIWQPSRTGAINPVAVFDPVELEGTTVRQATLNNLNFIEDLQLGIGDELEVYKANMIIPQVVENHTRSGTLELPRVCPSCGHEVTVREDNGKYLYCTNPQCQAKLIAKFSYFVSRDAMNIDGLSKQTLGFLIDKGWISCFADLYNLEPYKRKWAASPGFGTQSVGVCLQGIETSKHTTVARLITALGIPDIGKVQGKQLAKQFITWEAFQKAGQDTRYDFSRLDGFGPSANQEIHKWFRDVYEQERIPELISLLEFEDVTPAINVAASEFINGKTFVITGDVHLYKNRKELQEFIESQGGKVTGSVTSKTNYLINNDSTSKSSKNVKASALGIPVITEEQFQAHL